MSLLARKQITAGTTFLSSVKVAGGQPFKSPYCLELKLKAPAQLSVNLIAAGAVAPAHTVIVKSKLPGWVTVHFMVGPTAMSGMGVMSEFGVELKNLNAGQQVAIEEGQLTYGATMVAPHEKFESRFCRDEFTTAECLGILKSEVQLARTYLATLPYVLEWEMLLRKRFGKGSDGWSEGGREEFETFADGAQDTLLEPVEEELLKRLELDKVVEAVVEALKDTLPRMFRGLLAWIERLSIVGEIFQASAPSFTATDHQMAVLSGEVALGIPLRERLQEQVPLIHQRLSETIVKPAPTIGPKP